MFKHGTLILFEIVFHNKMKLPCYRICAQSKQINKDILLNEEETKNQ